MLMECFVKDTNLVVALWSMETQLQNIKTNMIEQSKTNWHTKTTIAVLRSLNLCAMSPIQTK